jgi:hypothetical protein
MCPLCGVRGPLHCTQLWIDILRLHAAVPQVGARNGQSNPGHACKARGSPFGLTQGPPQGIGEGERERARARACWPLTRKVN